MRELTLEEIQSESLQILSVIDSFCTENNISYSLGYGALIGAVRHQGFIPWDDDIDILMTRPNYQRFIKLFSVDESIKKCGLKLFAPELGNCFFLISRICDTKRTEVKTYFQWSDEVTGLWIDLFPIDAFSENEVGQIRLQNERCFNICGAKVPFSTDFNLRRNLIIFYKRIKYRNYDRDAEIKRYLNLIEKLPEFDKSQKVTNFGSPYEHTDIHRKQIFESYQRTQFSGKEVTIICSYDEYLRNIYGDYMILPPQSKRVRGHSDNKYFWK